MPDVDRHWPTKEAVLASIADPSTTEKDLGHALEVAGTFPADEAAATILPFMSHPSPFVREFALIGLSAHLAREDVRGALEQGAANRLVSASVACASSCERSCDSKQSS